MQYRVSVDCYGATVRNPCHPHETPSLPMQESKSSGQHRPGLLLWAFGVVSAVVLSSTMYQDYPLVLDEHGSYWLLQSDIPSSLMQRSLDYAAIPPLSGWAEQLSMLLPIGREQAFRLP